MGLVSGSRHDLTTNCGNLPLANAGDRSIVSTGTLTLDANGDGHTGDMTLANGHYKLFWTFAGEHGSGKHKVFWVACTSSPSPSPSPSSSSSPVS